MHFFFKDTKSAEEDIESFAGGQLDCREWQKIVFYKVEKLCCFCLVGMGPDQSASFQKREVELQPLSLKAVGNTLVNHLCSCQAKFSLSVKFVQKHCYPSVTDRFLTFNMDSMASQHIWFMSLIPPCLCTWSLSLCTSALFYCCT